MNNNSREIPPDWRIVHFQSYSESLDLRGRDLFSVLDRPKEEIAKLVGRIVAKAEMKTEELPGEYVTSMTGDAADEVHEWPNATLGPQFRHLILLFRKDRLIHLVWKFQSAPPPGDSKPWWRFWS